MPQTENQTFAKTGGADHKMGRAQFGYPLDAFLGYPVGVLKRKHYRKVERKLRLAAFSFIVG